MKVERWPRRPPQRWLLLRPQPWSWSRLEQGRLLASGLGRPPQEPGVKVALILPGSLCSHFQLPAPPGLKREEWPLLLEDRLLQAAEELACGCVSRDGGQLALVSVAQARLDDWLQTCAEWQLGVERCWAEFQLLPTTAPGSAWCWRRSGDLSLFKGCTAEGRQHWLAWPAVLGEGLPSAWGDMALQVIDGDWPVQWAELDRLPSLFEQRRARRLKLALAPGQWQVAAACLLLAAIWGGLWLNQQWRQAALYQAQVAAAVGPVSTPRQAAQLLKRQRQAEDERQLRLRQLDALQTQLAGWLSAQAGWRLSAAQFDGQRWTLRLHGPATTGPWQTLASEAGVTVSVAEADDGVSLVFDLGAAS
ncbi:GspL/Epsl periplasmic domain-containing protein [Pseudomonas sp. SDI]|uniref:GspL/Epsl periplasmic domain-containing protein n=1 Tax=Pseudomonas sp. SDI TaxID=2170734 RepID=UPI002114F7B7|nr:GspL/Epsl periplasmic domain-containing protein [Pseudomonas sp. SDI]